MDIENIIITNQHLCSERFEYLESHCDYNHYDMELSEYINSLDVYSERLFLSFVNPQVVLKLPLSCQAILDKFSDEIKLKKFSLIYYSPQKYQYFNDDRLLKIFQHHPQMLKLNDVLDCPYLSIYFLDYLQLKENEIKQLGTKARDYAEKLAKYLLPILGSEIENKITQFFLHSNPYFLTHHFYAYLYAQAFHQEDIVLVDKINRHFENVLTYLPEFKELLTESLFYYLWMIVSSLIKEEKMQELTHYQKTFYQFLNMNPDLNLGKISTFSDKYLWQHLFKYTCGYLDGSKETFSEFIIDLTPNMNFNQLDTFIKSIEFLKENEKEIIHNEFSVLLEKHYLEKMLYQTQNKKDIKNKKI